MDVLGHKYSAGGAKKVQAVPTSKDQNAIKLGYKSIKSVFAAESKNPTKETQKGKALNPKKTNPNDWKKEIDPEILMYLYGNESMYDPKLLHKL